MKSKIYHLLVALLVTIFASCEGEKDLYTVEGLLPIITSNLYMVGSGGPTAWDINNPYALTKAEGDQYTFVYHGELTPGEIKMCITVGNWSAPFIRPIENGEKIGKEPITDQLFQMYAGDPDNKWIVTENGIYTLTFDLKNWTLSSVYEGAVPGPNKGSIDPANVYLVGDAPLGSWTVDNPTRMTKVGPYKFTYEGYLTDTGHTGNGELKACMELGNWNVDWIRPLSNHVEINENGVPDKNFTISKFPDDRWKVTQAGYYRIDMDFKEWTIEVTPIDAPAPPEFEPILVEHLYVTGWGTPVMGWSTFTPIELERDKADDYIFYYKGELNKGGGFRFFHTLGDNAWKDGVIHPSAGTPGITSTDFTDLKFDYYIGDPLDVNFMVEEYGYYTLTLNLRDWTISCHYEGNKPPQRPVTPIMTDNLYLVGNALSTGWDIQNPTVLKKTGAYTFVYEGNLAEGEIKAYTQKSYDYEAFRPLENGCVINKQGVANEHFTYALQPDDKWKVTEAGNYRLTFDLEKWILKVEVLED